MTPQELIDLPGAGSAKAKLIKDGQWDEYNGLPYRDFAVDLSAEIIVEDTIVVRARHEDEARIIAVKKFASTYDCDESDVDALEVFDSKED